jgi:PadR family transcriptional regulator, regulatory protein PadR
MKPRPEIQQGALAWMALKTVDVVGPPHGDGIARRIEQISPEQMTSNLGTVYLLLLPLEQQGAMSSGWGRSENNRRARFYRLTPAGRKPLQAKFESRRQAVGITASFRAINAETRSCSC